MEAKSRPKRKKRLPKRLRGWNRYLWSALLVFLMIGWFYPVIGIIALTCMLAPVIVAAIKGKRQWCVTFCPRGVFNDVLLSQLSRQQTIPRIFFSRLFRVGFLVFLMYNFYTGVVQAYPSITGIGMVFVRMVSLTTALTIILGVVFHPRTWCAFCPMGFMANIAIYIRRAWIDPTPSGE